MAALDAQLIDLVEQQGTVVISQVWRASGSLDITALPPYIRAIVALPLRSDTSFHGILWLGYDHEHVFEQSEMTFLSTLASQAPLPYRTPGCLPKRRKAAVSSKPCWPARPMGWS